MTSAIERTNTQAVEVPLPIYITPPGGAICLQDDPRGVVLLTTVRTPNNVIIERYTNRIRLIYVKGNSCEYKPHGVIIHKNRKGLVSEKNNHRYNMKMSYI